MKWFAHSVVLLAALGIASAASAADPAKKAARQKDKPVRGQVVSVEGQNIKIKSPGKKGEEPTEQVLAVNDKTKIEIDGKEAKLADLKPRQRIMATLEAGAVTKIETLGKAGGKGETPTKPDKPNKPNKPNKKANKA